MLIIFSSIPFYTDFVCMPRDNDPPSPYITENLKFHPFSEDAIGGMDGCHLPPGKYYLADAGLPLASALLTPYRGVRYHLAEWGHADLRCIAFYTHCFLHSYILISPANAKELFNLRHASARNIIERMFGILKNRFAIL